MMAGQTWARAEQTIASLDPKGLLRGPAEQALCDARKSRWFARRAARCLAGGDASQRMRRRRKPRFLVTDHGCQFRGKFERAMARKPLQVDVVKGQKDRSKQFNGKVERFFKTFRLWQQLTLFARKKDWIQLKLDIFRAWYNTKRPMCLHGGRTAEQVWSDIPLPPARPMRENDPLKPAVSVSRAHFHGNCHLPTPNIQIIRAVQRTA